MVELLVTIIDILLKIYPIYTPPCPECPQCAALAPSDVSTALALPAFLAGYFARRRRANANANAQAGSGLVKEETAKEEMHPLLAICVQTEPIKSDR